MRRRSPLLVLVAVLALLGGACAGDGELGGPAVGGTPAAVIGDHEVTNADLRDEVEEWSANPAMLQAIGITDLGTEGRRTTQVVSFVLSHRVVSEQARLMLLEARRLADGGEVDLAELGVDGEVLADPTDEEIDAILGQLDQQFASPQGGSVFQAFPEDFRQLLARDLAFQDRLQTMVQLGIDAPEVSVNPRFGVADVLQGGIVQVTPPTGPLPSLGA
ncbi:MAG TPA: hypothetical protein VFV42_03515 [Acidimicrobiales bacterium]|nr:hypothetical protein [Acidimicrobiales bacterium]